MSVSQFSFGALWLAHGRYQEKLQAFFKNPAALLISSLFVLHIIGVTYSTDINYALKDVRIKLPILIIPFMFVGFPKISHQQFERLIYFFVGSVFGVSLFVTIIHFVNLEEVRHIISREVISHIRFSLSINLALFYLIFLRISRKKHSGFDLLAILILLWLFFFLFFLEAFTGIIVFFILIFFILSYLAAKSKSLTRKTIFIGVIIIGGIGIGGYLIHFVNQYHQVEHLEKSQLDKYTASGNLYYHDLEGGTENGAYVYIYINENEMRKAWSKRSALSFDSLDLKDQRLKYTLIRYLTSKGLRKDKEGVEALDQQDIRNIENGIANYHYTQGIGINSRLMKILFEYDNYIRTGDPSGHSVMQRVEYWKTSWSIIKKNFWFGVGTGDMNVAFQNEYEELNSKLKPESRLRAHNQYLSIWVGLGFVGLLWFLAVVFYAPILMKGFKNLYFLMFFITFTVSMLTEDTIETQAGVTFFVFFMSVFLFMLKDGDGFNLKINEKNQSENPGSGIK
jgi:hypothetical protein